MWRVLKIGSAFIGIIVGAGFASGQEILQYFTSFGHLGTAAAILSTGLSLSLGGYRVRWVNGHAMQLLYIAEQLLT